MIEFIPSHEWDTSVGCGRDIGVDMFKNNPLETVFLRIFKFVNVKISLAVVFQIKCAGVSCCQLR